MLNSATPHRRKDIPLIPDMFKNDSKRKTVSSSPQSLSQARESDDDSTSMSSYGLFVETSSNKIGDFGDGKSVDNISTSLLVVST